MKKTVIVSAVCLSLAVIFFSLSTQAAPIKLRISHDLPPFTCPGMGIGAWAKAVNENAGGRVVVEVFPASTVADQRGALEMMQAGVADGCMLSLGVHRQVFPLCQVTRLEGLGFPNTVKGQMAHAKALSALIDNYPAVAAEFKDFKMIFDIINPDNVMLSAKREIRLPSDLKGLKIGATGKTGAFIKKKGGASVFCVPPEAYQKLQTGVVDALPIHFVGIGDFKLFEIAKYILDISWGQADIPLMMSMRSWKKIPAQDQQIIMEAAAIGQRVAFEEVEKRSKKTRSTFMDLGGTIIKPTKEERAAWEKDFGSLWEEYIAENEAAGRKDARSIFNDWKKDSEQSWN